MSTAKLHQIIAVEKGIKGRTQRFLTNAYHTFQKPSQFGGFAKEYSKKNEDGEDFPPESQRVQVQAEDLLAEIAEQAPEYFDVVATKDAGNCIAKADVVVDGKTLLEQVPATTLLFLEKQLTDLHTALEALPVLDPSHTWTHDAGSGLFKSEPRMTTKTKKVAKPLVLYPATEEHPAQTQLVQEDQVIGTWEMIAHSGAVTVARKKELIGRVLKLLKAVKFAREEANSTEVQNKQLGEKIFGYLMAK